MKNILVVLLLVIPLVGFSQISDGDYQKVVIQTLELMNEYERSSRFVGRNAIKNFNKNFKDISVQIPNDILRLNQFDQLVSVEDYTDLLYSTEGFNKLTVYVELIDLKIVSKTPKTGEVIIEVNKTIEGRWNDKSLTLLFADDSEEQIVLRKMFKQKIIVSYNLSSDNFLIESIENVNREGKYVILVAGVEFMSLNGKNQSLVNHLEFDVIHNGRKINFNDSYLLVEGLDEDWEIEVVYNRNDEYVLKNRLLDNEDFDDSKYKYSGENRDLKRLDQNVLVVSFKEPLYSLNASYIVPFSKPFNLINQTTIHHNIDFESNQIISVSLGRKIPVISTKLSKYFEDRGSDTKVNVKLLGGLTYYSYTNSLSVDNNLDTYEEIDSHDMQYIRHVELINVSELMNVEVLNFQLGTEFSFVRGDLNMLAFMKYGFTSETSGSYSSTVNMVKYSGYYEDLFGIMLVDSYEDFGLHENISGVGDLEFVDHLTTINAGVGLSYNLKPNISLYGELAYTLSESALFSTNHLLINTSISDDNIDNDLNSITSSDINIEIDYYSVNIGVSYKF